MTDAENLLLDIFEASVGVYSKGPPMSHATFDAYQAHARAQSWFVEERGVALTSLDTSDAGRKRYSRMRLSLAAQGLIRINRLSATTTAVCLTAAGLALAEELSGERAPKDLREAIQAMEREAQEQA